VGRACRPVPQEFAGLWYPRRHHYAERRPDDGHPGIGKVGIKAGRRTRSVL